MTLDEHGDAGGTRATLVYDGDCAFCTRCAGWAEARLPARVRCAPYQGLDLDQLGITEAMARAAAWWVEPDGRMYSGHRAIAAALRAMGGGWRLAGWVIATPPTSAGAALVYRLVARNRHRLPGGTRSCSIRSGASDGRSPPSE